MAPMKRKGERKSILSKSLSGPYNSEQAARLMGPEVKDCS